MIWVRRVFAVLLGLLFVPLFLVTLVLLRVNATFLSPTFYVAELRKADLFTFGYDKLLPSAYDEAIKSAKDAPAGVTKTKADAISFLRDVLPPQWLQERTEEAITAGLPYLLGGAYEFALTVPLADRVEALGKALKDQRRQETAYNLLFDEVVTPAVEEQLASSKPPLGMTFGAKDVVTALKEAAPQSWVQAQIAQTVDTLVPYATGKEPHFAVRVNVPERLVTLKEATKKLLAKSHVYDVLSHPEFAQEVDKQLRDQGPLPFGIVVTSRQVVPLLQQVFPATWLQSQVEGSLDQVVRYLTTEKETTVVRVPLKDRVKTALEGERAPVKVFLRDLGIYDRVYREGVVPQVVNLVAQAAGGAGSASPNQPVVSLPITPQRKLVVTRQELQGTLQEALQGVSPQFLQGQVEGALDALTPYLAGDKEHFAVELSVAQLVEQVLPSIEKLVEQKLTQEYQALPTCTAQQALALATGGLKGELPLCRPPGFTMAQVQQALGIPGPALTQQQAEALCRCSLDLVLKPLTLQDALKLLGVDLGQQVRQVVRQAVPSLYSFTDTDLRKALGPKDEELLDRVLGWTRQGFTYTDADLRKDLSPQNQKDLNRILGWTRQGFTYTDADLRKDLGPENQEDLDKALGWVRNGFTFTQEDLRKLVVQQPDGTATWQQFQDVRQTLQRVRSYRFLLLLVPALLLAAIGFLGGRTWRGRVAWAAVPLLIAAGMAYAAFGPVYKSVAQPLLHDQLAEATRGASGVAQLAADKAVVVAETVTSDFFSGLEKRSLFFLSIAMAALAAAIFWTRFWPRRIEWGPGAGPPRAKAPPTEEPPQEPGPPAPS